MNRANEININTKTYWNGVYGSEEKRRGYAETGTDKAVHGMQKTQRFLRTLQEIKPGDKFLDIGCGVGVMTNLAKRTYPTCEVWGTDISDKVIADNIAENPEIKYLHQYIGDQRKLPDDYFDVVFSGETLEHLDHPDLLFKDAYQALKTGGKFILTTPKENAIQSPEHTWFFTYDDIEKLYKTNGFKQVRFVYLPDLEHVLVIYAVGIKG